MLANYDPRKDLKEHDVYKGYYHVPITDVLLLSKDGKVFSLHTNRVVKSSLGSAGYWIAKVWDGVKINYFNLHRLIAITFIPIPLELRDKSIDELEVNHLDSNRANCNIDNLEWTTPQGNIAHAREFGGMKDNIRIYTRDIRNGQEETFYSISQFAKSTGLHPLQVARHLRSNNVGRLTINWKVFRTEDMRTWPVVAEEDRIESSLTAVSYWSAFKEGMTAPFMCYKLDDLSEYLGVSTSAIKRHRVSPKKILDGWVIELKYKDSATKIEGLEDSPRKTFEAITILVHDYETGLNTVVSSLSEAAKLTNVPKATLSYRFKRSNDFKIKHYHLSKA